jgi:hypothetical protein
LGLFRFTEFIFNPARFADGRDIAADAEKKLEEVLASHNQQMAELQQRCGENMEFMCDKQMFDLNLLQSNTAAHADRVEDEAHNRVAALRTRMEALQAALVGFQWDYSICR